ncbi:hypothetical protein SAMN05660330_04150 [Desulforhopalus singaporensis]|uniref:Uncharacterized protein n=1 Tax=Desulforhopalus singaporensis TaxID=91360 RepID=A0A1H0VN58_9BACT|nr:hypothetical protein SAMN05660330_04150 [Desulforhopalus singaporensis]
MSYDLTFSDLHRDIPEGMKINTEGPMFTIFKQRQLVFSKSFHRVAEKIPS